MWRSDAPWTLQADASINSQISTIYRLWKLDHYRGYPYRGTVSLNCSSSIRNCFLCIFKNQACNNPNSHLPQKSKEEREQTLTCPHRTTNPFPVPGYSETLLYPQHGFYQLPYNSLSIQLAVEIWRTAWRDLFLFNPLKIFEEGDCINGSNRSTWANMLP